MVVLQSVHCTFQEVIKALDGVSLTIEQGETVALLGPSGSGKSTLLSVIAGFEQADSGVIEVAGRPIEEWCPQEFRTRVMGFLFQRFHLFEHLSAVENVELALFPTCPDAGQRRARSTELLRRVGLGARIDSRAVYLSGGERQRVAFCRSIANQPRLLLADEPTGSLDRESTGMLLELLSEHVDRAGGTLIVATHDSGVAQRCGRIVELVDGRVVAS